MLSECNRYGEVQAAEVRAGDGPFHCSACQGSVILKQGRIKIPHFAHLPGTGEHPVQAILEQVQEAQLQATIEPAKQYLRPEDLDSLDLIESRYVPIQHYRSFENYLMPRAHFAQLTEK